jgi:peptidyl-prolyl cis-trans isomerase SurA
MRKHMIFLSVLLPMLLVAESVQAEMLDKVVAVVNNNVITASELNEQVGVLRKQMELKKVEVPSDDVLRKQVLKHLIDVDIQLQLAKQNDIAVDSAELNESIEKIAVSNHLTLTQLREELQKQGMDWEVYRENVRKEILMSRIQQQAVGKDVVVSTQQVENYLKTAHVNEKESQIYHLQNIVIPLPEEPTTEQVKRAKEKADSLLKKLKQGADFSTIAIAESSGEYALEGGDLGERHLAELPEIFGQKAINMSVGEVAGPLRAGNGFQLIKLIAIQGNDGHHEVSKTHVRHILIKPTVNMTEDEASKQIHNLYQQLKSGKDFGLMAKQYSLDASSAIKGGDLGWVTGDELVPSFAEAMDKLPLHTISDPVKTPFGWHLIEVLERKKMDDSVAFKRQQVRHFLQQRKFAEAVENWQQHLRADAYVNVLDKALA